MYSNFLRLDGGVYPLDVCSLAWEEGDKQLCLDTKLAPQDTEAEVDTAAHLHTWYK